MTEAVRNPFEPVFSKSEGGHALQVWPHRAPGTVEVRSHSLHSAGRDAVYTLSGHDVRIFAQDILTTAGGDRTFVVSRFIAYPVEEDGAVLHLGVGNNRITVAADSSPERLETMAANFAAAAAYLRAAPEREERARALLRQRRDALAVFLFGAGETYEGLTANERTAIKSALRAQDERATAS